MKNTFVERELAVVSTPDWAHKLASRLARVLPGEPVRDRLRVVDANPEFGWLRSPLLGDAGDWHRRGVAIKSSELANGIVLPGRAVGPTGERWDVMVWDVTQTTAQHLALPRNRVPLQEDERDLVSGARVRAMLEARFTHVLAPLPPTVPVETTAIDIAVLDVAATSLRAEVWGLRPDTATFTDDTTVWNSYANRHGAMTELVLDRASVLTSAAAESYRNVAGDGWVKNAPFPVMTPAPDSASTPWLSAPFVAPDYSLDR